jgi:hypothetical protein
MSLPEVATVNVATMAKGQQFAGRLFDGTDARDACDETNILLSAALKDEICRRVFMETKDAIAEAFVRIADDVTTRERQR